MTGEAGVIRIVVDSTADTPPEVAAAYGITTVPIPLQFGSETFRDNVDISRDEFYRRLVESAELPRTAAPPVGAFAETFRALSADGSEIISISIAGALSATFHAARQGAELVDGARIVCIDSGSLAMPLTYLAVAAARAAQAGQTFDQIVHLLETLKPRLVLYFGLDTLHYLEKGGRISHVRALLGALLSIKPILEVSQSQVHAVAQVRTSRRVLARLVELAAARGAYEELSVLYSTGREQAEHLAGLCAEAGLMARDRILVTQVNAGLGTHAGPGAIGISGLLR